MQSGLLRERVVSRPPTACTLKSLIVLCWTRLMRFDRLSRMRFFFYNQFFMCKTKPILFCKIFSMSQCLMIKSNLLERATSNTKAYNVVLHFEHCHFNFPEVICNNMHFNGTEHLKVPLSPPWGRRFVICHTFNALDKFVHKVYFLGIK